MTTIHTRQLQQYAQDNYNNTHKTTTKIHTRQLQKYTQDNYNNTHKTTTTTHTRQQTTIQTRHLKIQHVEKVNNTKVKKILYILYIVLSIKRALQFDFDFSTCLIVSYVGVALFCLIPCRQLNDITFIYTRIISFNTFSNSLLFFLSYGAAAQRRLWPPHS